MKKHEIRLERVKELLEYNKDTGVFTWKQSRGKVKAGEEAGHVQAGYKKITIDRLQIKIHRLAWFICHGSWPSGQIDHIDGNKLNNKISNLRDVPMSINMQNRYAQRKTSGLPQGVTHGFKGKFIANIRIGIFNSAEEAGEAYMKTKRLIHDGCTR